MTFKATSQPINVAEVRQLAKLEGSILARKQERDRQLEAIIRGEDDRILLVIGPCSSDKLSWNTPSVWQHFKKKSKIGSLWSCGSTLPSHGPMAMAIRA